jgi:predicted Zn-dependent protease
VGHFALGQPEEALSALDRAHKNRPELVWVLYPLAVTLAELDRIEEAQAVLAPIEKKDDYIGASVYGFVPFSVVD